MIYKKELKEDELENVDGGYIFYNRNGNQKWQVINDSTGKVERDGLARREYAKDYAKKHGFSTDEISWSDLDKLRKDFEIQKAEQERQ